MPSNINPNIIDGEYPVAGQDNNSQGFRDNFTNIRTNFQSAANEITELQNKAVLKSALAGSALNNDMAGAVLNGAKIQNFSATRNAIGSVSGSLTLDYTAGHYQTFITSGSVTLGFTGWPAAGSWAWLRVQVDVRSTDHVLILPATVNLNLSSVASISPGQAGVSNTVRFLAVGIYEFEFTTSNGGTNITVNDLNGGLKPQTLLLSDNFVLSNTNAVQAVLDNQTAALQPGVSYAFEAQYLVSRSAGTTSHNIAVQFDYSGAFSAVSYVCDSTSTAASPTAADAANAIRVVGNSASETVVTADNDTATEFVTITMRGIMRTTGVAGTLIPRIKYSAAPGGAPTVLANSYFRIAPV